MIVLSVASMGKDLDVARHTVHNLSCVALVFPFIQVWFSP